MKAYITTLKLVQWIERLIKLDGRPIKEIAKELGYSNRHFLNLRTFDVSKPLAYLEERIKVFNELSPEIDAGDRPRVEVDGPHEWFETLDLERDRIPEEYRGYTIAVIKRYSGSSVLAKKKVLPKKVQGHKEEIVSVVETSTHKYADEAAFEAREFIDYMEDGGDPPERTGHVHLLNMYDKGPTYLAVDLGEEGVIDLSVFSDVEEIEE